MKTRYAITAAAALALAMGAAQAHDYGKRAMSPSNNAIHSGGMSADDQALAERVAAALATDSKLVHITATVVANNGRISLNGTGNAAQGARAEKIASEIAGRANVSGSLDGADG
jgi:osmotically-inducible protein OsmY